MTRRIVILLALLLLPLLLWLAYATTPDDAGSAPPAPDLGELPAGEDSVPASRATSGVPAAEPEPERAARVVTEVPAPLEQPPFPAAATWIEVLVADQATGAPVAGADVAWVDDSTPARIPPSLDDPQWQQRDPDAVARRYGWRARSDERGVVRVHLSVAMTVVFARAGTRFGKLFASKAAPVPAGGYRLQLVDDRTLLVQVVDSLGRPAPGAPIGLAEHGADGAFLRSWGAVTQSRQPDGHARIPHLQDWRDRPHGGPAPATTAQWRVRFEVPGLDDPGVAFDPKSPPETAIVLRLPPTGSVVARVEFDGRPVPGCSSVGLYAGTLADGSAESRAWNRPIGPDGQARFPCIPVGRTFVAFAIVSAARFRHEFKGPVALGQEVSVVLTPADDEIVLAGRVLDERREPLRDTSVWLRARSTMAASSAMPRTDAEGRFLLFIGKASGGPARLEQLVVEWRPPEGPPLRASLPARELRPGVQDVGDLVLERGRSLVTGRFMTGGEPYARPVSFIVQHARTGGARATWEQLEGSTSAQDGDAFEVRGDPGPGRHRLVVWASDDQLPVAPVEFVPGTRDLTVQITRGAKLMATALLPRGLPWGVAAVLEPDPPRAETFISDVPPELGPGMRLEAQIAEVEPGKYLLAWHRAVPPGTYRLELRLWGAAEPLRSIPALDLPLPAGDPRVENIDLRDLVTVLTVRTSGGAKKPGSDAVVFLPPLPANEWRGYRVMGGVVRIPVRHGPVDLLVAAGGSRPREVRGARGEVDVVLEPWPEAVLVFRDLPALPDGCSLHAVLGGTGPGEPGRYVAGSQFERGAGKREALLQPALSVHRVEDGRARVTVGDGPRPLAVHLQEGSGRGRPLAGVTPVEVFAGDAPIEVRVPADAVQKAIAEQKSGAGR